jgi:hypothetical protein
LQQLLDHCYLILIIIHHYLNIILQLRHYNPR